MRIIIHDLPEQKFLKQFPDECNKDDVCVISDNGKIRNCTGCFGCWLKTPGTCVIKDGYENIGKMLSKADSVAIISDCVYGGFSPFVKNVLDRSISFLLPFFKTRKDETHHAPRYNVNYDMNVYFYGEDVTEDEKIVAQDLVAANSKNFFYKQYNVSFFESVEELYGGIAI